jgi:hypothetical protein
MITLSRAGRAIALGCAATLAGPGWADGRQGDPAGPPRGGSAARPILRARYALETQAAAGARFLPGRPSFGGKVLPRLPDGTLGPLRSVPEALSVQPQSPPVTTTGGDVFLADGSEEAVGVNPFNGRDLVAVYNQGYSNTSRMKTSVDGNATWTTGTFPNGAGNFSGYTYDPWAVPGNGNGILFSSLIRTSSVSGSTAAHVVVARSSDGGVSWPRFYEATRSGMDDREMFDVDRSPVLGGGSGSTHDGKIYLDYDLYDATGAYRATYFQAVSSGGVPLLEIQVSDSTANGFDGFQIQPVAGIADGQVYLMGNGVSVDGLTYAVVFHEVTGGGTSLLRDKAFFTFSPAGRLLGTSGRIGLNGHRLNGPSMDIDRSSGRRRGALYVVTDRNPNPPDPSLDQGDVYLSISTDGGSTWSSAPIPGQAAGKTQYFSMIDVDDDGWIHVAYYQNETGSVDGGVLNAGAANVYYTVSSDGGLTWAPHTRVNDLADTLNLFDPPQDLSVVDYYMIGDFAQVQAGFVSGTRVAYVCFTGYDKTRDDVHQNQKRERVICTTVTPPLDGDWDGVFDSADNCPAVYNPNQRDTDGNGVGDACQNFPADVNVDDTGSSQGRIDGSDLFILARAFGACVGDAAYDARVDLNPDDCVDGADLALMASVWGLVLP